MNRRLLTILTIAFLVAGICALVVYRMVGSKVTTGKKQATTRVVAAATDVKLGTTLTSADLTTIDIAGALPQGARPDLSVDGTIDLERMGNVLSVGRPAMGNENSTISLFRLAPDGRTATRVPVKVGRASVNSIQVLGGLKEGDTVILSDMSRWDASDHIRLN